MKVILMDKFKANLETKSLVTLANANYIVFRIVNKIAGNDISNSINGSRINQELVYSLVDTYIANNIAK